MNTVRDFILIKNKMHKYHWVKPDETVATALKKMSDHNLGAILVLEKNQVTGLFSERDYARKLLLQGRSSLTTPVKEVMTTDVLYVTPDYLLDECMALMTSKKIRHLPVIDQGRLLSVLSMDEVAEALLEGKEFMIAELTRYITGAPEPEVYRPKFKTVRELIWSKDRPVSA